jgi:hypothetical protein
LFKILKKFFLKKFISYIRAQIVQFYSTQRWRKLKDKYKGFMAVRSWMTTDVTRNGIVEKQIWLIA